MLDQIQQYLGILITSLPTHSQTPWTVVDGAVLVWVILPNQLLHEADRTQSRKWAGYNICSGSSWRFCRKKHLDQDPEMRQIPHSAGNDPYSQSQSTSRPTHPHDFQHPNPSQSAYPPQSPNPHNPLRDSKVYLLPTVSMTPPQPTNDPPVPYPSPPMSTGEHVAQNHEDWNMRSGDINASPEIEQGKRWLGLRSHVEWKPEVSGMDLAKKIFW